MSQECGTNLEVAKNDLKELLSYKSDMVTVEKLRDQLVTKCDYDYVQNLL